MTGNGRGTMRPQGRAPPFLLIGLLVVLCILGYSYWNASSRSNEQASRIVVLQDEVRMLSTRKLEAEKQSEASSGRLSELERERSSLSSRILESEKMVESLRNDLKSRDDELNSARNELDAKKESLVKCEQDSTGIQQELQKLKEEAETLKQDAANKPAQCDQNACEEPIKNIMTVLVNALGRQLIISTLQNNNIDTDKFIAAEAGIKIGQQQPVANPANPANPQNPEAVPANQQQPGVNVADNQQPVANPVDPNQPGVVAADKQGAGQIQPPQDVANPADAKDMNKEGEDEGEEEGEGEGDEEGEEKQLKFEPEGLNKLAHMDVANDNDAIDRMNENMAEDQRNKLQP